MSEPKTRQEMQNEIAQLRSSLDETDNYDQVKWTSDRIKTLESAIDTDSNDGGHFCGH